MKTIAFLYERVNVDEIRTVNAKPTPDMPLGWYKVIANGLFYGHFQIVRTWTGEKAVIAEYATQH